ncbi:hypothetical protein D3C80_1945770 [compost metagenome]
MGLSMARTASARSRRVLSPLVYQRVKAARREPLWRMPSLPRCQPAASSRALAWAASPSLKALAGLYQGSPCTAL